MEKIYDEELNEEIEINEPCIYGLCPLCGLPNRKPKLFRDIYFCKDCFLTRTDDCLELVNVFRRLKDVKI